MPVVLISGVVDGVWREAGVPPFLDLPSLSFSKSVTSRERERQLTALLLVSHSQ